MNGSNILVLIFIFLFAGKDIYFLKKPATSNKKSNYSVSKSAESANSFSYDANLVNGEDLDLDDNNDLCKNFPEQKFVSLINKNSVFFSEKKYTPLFKSNIPFTKLYCVYRL